MKVRLGSSKQCFVAHCLVCQFNGTGQVLISLSQQSYAYNSVRIFNFTQAENIYACSVEIRFICLNVFWCCYISDEEHTLFVSVCNKMIIVHILKLRVNGFRCQFCFWGFCYLYLNVEWLSLLFVARALLNHDLTFYAVFFKNTKLFFFLKKKNVYMHILVDPN